MSEVPTDSDEAMADWLIKLYQDKVRKIVGRLWETKSKMAHLLASRCLVPSPHSGQTSGLPQEAQNFPS